MRIVKGMRRVRLAILGDSPCDACHAACCRQNGHAYAALLKDQEVRRFAPFSVQATLRHEQRIVSERVLPYVAGRCQFLGDDDRCTIYEDRPAACRAFQCIAHFNAEGIGRHGVFLQRNPRVRALLEEMEPGGVEEEAAAR